MAVMTTQFELIHGHEPYVVLIDVRGARQHIWSAIDREQAERWVDLWHRLGAEASMITMSDYRDMQGKSDS